MSYATIMVHVDAGGELDGRVRIAAQLADRFQSRLIGISSWTPRPPFAIEGVVIDPKLTTDEIAGRSVALKARGEEFKKVAGLKGQRVEWRCAQEFPTPYVMREARAADLLVITRERRNLDPYLYVDPGSLLLGAGRPVLLVPPGVSSMDAKKVVVAWKDTREARRAIRDALPLLKQAETVIVVEFCQSPHEVGPAQQRLGDVVQYLASHHITSVLQRVQPLKDVAEDSLLQFVQRESADLIVAGAYGHSRVGEWIFGGVTEALLTRSPVCCLLSH
ncbi:universal stress protein [Rhodoplanes sp. Z2-YC6860]|uniref:universal stress protein n=1 Tax=Rhodoplanes sp. Z2-YC6860 TaxID=674703 RepID=UPI00078E1A47|nr:universal stress protein [Rhodoplanes sp. Z2-YC6860]AMN38502.1 universal stress protein UspA [Rhodoplanes sp. Z2-YC6860]